MSVNCFDGLSCIATHWMSACGASAVQIVRCVVESQQDDYQIQDGFAVLGMTGLECPVSELRPNIWDQPRARFEICRGALKSDKAAVSFVLSGTLKSSAWNSDVHRMLVDCASNLSYTGALTCDAMSAARADLQQLVCLGHRTCLYALKSVDAVNTALERCVDCVWVINTSTEFWTLLRDTIWRAQIPFIIDFGRHGNILLDNILTLRILKRDKVLLVYLFLVSDICNIWTNAPAGTPVQLLRMVECLMSSGSFISS